MVRLIVKEKKRAPSPPTPDPSQLLYYQLRFDSHDIQIFLDLHNRYLNICGYTYGLEYKQDGTEHIQAMFSTDTALTQNERTIIRERIKKEIFKKTEKRWKQPVSLTTANFPHALFNYCNKQEDSYNMFSEIDTTYIKSLPLNSKNQWKDLLRDHITKNLLPLDLTRHDFYLKVCQFYIEQDRSLPRRQQLLTLAVKYDFISLESYLQDIKLFYRCYHDDSDEENYRNNKISDTEIINEILYK